MLLDGNSLTYRAFFALPPDMATASGQVTNAVFGFTSMLVNLIRDHQPDGIAVAFDRAEPTFRHEMLPEYKAQREKQPDVLYQQIGLVKEVLGALDIPVVEAPGFEADDLLATMATRARDHGDDVIIVTGDRDAYQLVEDPHIKVLYNRRGVSDYVLYDEAGIKERTGVTPALYPQYAALRGDPSDNLPGVPGVGEKTAARLINKYGGIDGIYEHIDEMTPKLRQNLIENEERVRKNLEAMVLRRDAPVDVDVTDLHWGNFDPAEVARVFEFLEFSSLYRRLREALDGRLPELEGGTAVLEAEPGVSPSAMESGRLLRRLATDGERLPISVALSEGRNPTIVGVALVTDPDAGDVGWVPGDHLDDPGVMEALGSLLGREGPPIDGHRIKPTMRALLDMGLDLRNLELDTALGAYLLDPSDGRYALEDLLRKYAKLELASEDEAAQGQLGLDLGSAEGDGDSGPGPLVRHHCRRALAVSRLVEPLLGRIQEEGVGHLYHEVENPLVRVLAKMEHIGVAVDRDELVRLRDTLVAECDRLMHRIWEDAGHEFNVNSTKQLREVLFEELGLEPQKRTKTGYSTDAATLEKLRGAHPIVDHLLEYREVEKLRSTYAQGLLDAVAPDGRIHATFNQMVARTGRLSSEDPNLHNIPVRTERGREFRRAFVAAEGFRLLVADYNQIELRVIAHLAEDPGLIAAFAEGRDIHTATAASVFGVPEDRVTPEMRAKAKMVSYGLAYGMEAYGLAQRLGIPTEEATGILDAYFAAFPNVRSYMERVVEETRERGYTETEFGRRRRIPELNSPNYRVRQAAERQAMNAPIQGLAADIFKVALVRLDAAIEERGHTSRIVLQIHDEIMLEVTPGEADEVRELTVDTMRHAADLRVPLEVHVAVGDSWADAKG